MGKFLNILGAGVNIFATILLFGTVLAVFKGEMKFLPDFLIMCIVIGIFYGVGYALTAFGNRMSKG